MSGKYRVYSLLLFCYAIICICITHISVIKTFAKNAEETAFLDSVQQELNGAALEEFNQKTYWELSPKLIEWNEENFAYSGIKLMPYQCYPADRLLNNPEQKGMILYHALGSGKTFTAIAYTKMMPDMNVVIVVPGFLKFQWQNNLSLFKEDNPNRYKIVSYEELEQISDDDLSSSIIIVDEIHKIVNGMLSDDVGGSSENVKIYNKIKKAKKNLLLTATPLYDSILGLAYIVNLASGKDLMPLQFKQILHKHFVSKNTSAFIKNNFTQYNISTLFGLCFSPFLPLSAILYQCTDLSKYIDYHEIMVGVEEFMGVKDIVRLLHPAWILYYMVGSVLGPKISAIYKSSIPSLYDFKEIDSEKLAKLIAPYYSYYELQSDVNQMPTCKRFEHRFKPNASQYYLWLSALHHILSLEDLSTLLLDHNQYSIKILGEKYYENNLDRLSEVFMSNNDFLSAINNVITQKKGKNGKTIIHYPPKFKEMLEVIDQRKGGVVIWSKFYYNGLLQFRRYLKDINYSISSAIITPYMKQSDIFKVVQGYNNGEIELLMLHPDVTEGLSLLKTNQLHIMDIPSNSSLLPQIEGRVIRHQSHITLPPELQYVELHLWRGTNFSIMKSYYMQLILRRYTLPEVSSDYRHYKFIADMDATYFYDDLLNAKLEAENHSVDRMAAAMSQYNLDEKYRTGIKGE